MINLTAFIQVVVKLGADDTTDSSNSYSGGFKEECLVEINSAWCTVTYLLW